MDEEMSLLKQKVILSLKRAAVPAMQGCNFDFGNGMNQGFYDGDIRFGAYRDLGSLYQNELVRIYSLMTVDEFKKIKCTFSVKFDPEIKKGYTEKIPLNSFQELVSSDKLNLFKLAAKDSIDRA